MIDLYGRSALHYAALNNRPQLLALFYSNGLKLDHRDNKVNFMFIRVGFVDNWDKEE